MRDSSDGTAVEGDELIVVVQPLSTFVKLPMTTVSADTDQLDLVKVLVNSDIRSRLAASSGMKKPIVTF